MACLVPTQTFRWLIHTALVPTVRDGRLQDMPHEHSRTLQQAYLNTDTGAAVWQAVPEVVDYEQPGT